MTLRRLEEEQQEGGGGGRGAAGGLQHPSPGPAPAGQGYVHQVDHHPAAVHAEAVSFDVTSCERKQEVRSLTGGGGGGGGGGAAGTHVCPRSC